MIYDLFKCPRCKGLVELKDATEHNDWHERLVNLLHTLDNTRTLTEPTLGAVSTFEL